jgi:hypothetical protein
VDEAMIVPARVDTMPNARIEISHLILSVLFQQSSKTTINHLLK